MVVIWSVSFSPAESTVFILLSCLKRMKINKEEIGNGQIKNTVLYHCPLDEKRLSSVTRLDRYLNVLGDKFAKVAQMLGDFLGFIKTSFLTKTCCCNCLSRFGGKIGYFFTPTSMVNLRLYNP